MGARARARSREHGHAIRHRIVDTMIGFPQEGDALYDGADKIIYAGYFPMGLTLERIFTDMPHVPFKDHVWPKFLSENARRLLKIGR